jgi:predicted transcriptional regulator
LRRESEALRASVAADTKRAATELRRAGLSTRDVGEILGISSARVAQIERESAAA